MIEKLVTLKYPYLNVNMEKSIESELNKFLSSIDKKNIFKSLNYIIREMASNANKANLKRVYFNTNDLDIESMDDYEKGIKSFRDELKKNYSRYSEIAEKQGYYVRLDFLLSKGFLIFLTSNNSPILPVEKERFLEKLSSSIRITRAEDFLDIEEIGGSGVCLSVMLLKEIGLDENYINLIHDDKSTQLKVVIPLSLISKQEIDFISDEIVNEINDLPQFPEHILDMRRSLSDDNNEVNFTKISHIIKKDPLLIVELIKLANSALYMLPKKIYSIEEAIRIIGFKGLRNLIITYTTNNIFMEKYKAENVKKIMNHSYEVAYYAQEIAKKFKMNNIVDDAYLAGILHDFGKIIINSIKPGILDKIKKICTEKGISRDVLENLTRGYNHSINGAKLLKKWGFPQNIVEAILHHHVPKDAKPEYLVLTEIIYLADIIYSYLRNEYNFKFIDSNILNNYNLNNENDFDFFAKSISIQLEKIIA